MTLCPLSSKFKRQLKNPSPSIDAYLYTKNIPAKFHPDAIWNNKALKTVAAIRRTTRWVAIWDQFLIRQYQPDGEDDIIWRSCSGIGSSGHRADRTSDRIIRIVTEAINTKLAWVNNIPTYTLKRATAVTNCGKKQYCERYENNNNATTATKTYGDYCRSIAGADWLTGRSYCTHYDRLWHLSNCYCLFLRAVCLLWFNKY